MALLVIAKTQNILKSTGCCPALSVLFQSLAIWMLSRNNSGVSMKDILSVSYCHTAILKYLKKAPLFLLNRQIQPPRKGQRRWTPNILPRKPRFSSPLPHVTASNEKTMEGSRPTEEIGGQSAHWCLREWVGGLVSDSEWQWVVVECVWCELSRICVEPKGCVRFGGVCWCEHTNACIDL